MVSRRKVEEEIARTKDPIIRKQLQDLLDKRSQRWEEKKKKTTEMLNDGAEGIAEVLMYLISWKVILALIIAILIFGLFLKLIGA
jgi:hypothetical protein